MSGKASSFAAISDRVALRPYPDHRHSPKSELQRIGDGDDLERPGVDQPLDTLAHGGLGQPDGGTEAGVRHPPIGLQLLDDRPIDVVQIAAARTAHGTPRPLERRG